MQSICGILCDLMWISIVFLPIITGFVRGNPSEDYFSCEGARVQTFKQSKCCLIKTRHSHISKYFMHWCWQEINTNQCKTWEFFTFGRWFVVALFSTQEYDWKPVIYFKFLGACATITKVVQFYWEAASKQSSCLFFLINIKEVSCQFVLPD